MTIVDDLKALQPTIYQHALDEFQKAMDAGLTSEAEIQRETGFMDRVASRAAYYFTNLSPAILRTSKAALVTVSSTRGAWPNVKRFGEP
ncbi:hypothetical protein HED55_00330 [Ochrobactrum haematophilum]|uniref:Uncharacterized protein n=1 Tax=Brucella haematophila TaxID=419474 RepID=A0ABX1DJG9_9HYPH|nr:hypothetical protein [Brucella haematophila]